MPILFLFTFKWLFKWNLQNEWFIDTFILDVEMEPNSWKIFDFCFSFKIQKPKKFDPKIVIHWRISLKPRNENLFCVIVQ